MKDTEGNVWGIPRLGLMGHTWNFTWLRTDWLEELGIPFDNEEMTIDDQVYYRCAPAQRVG
jgi:ABC-type glycerol-3-phosphate transport system substrate-binding protein